MRFNRLNYKLYRLYAQDFYLKLMSYSHDNLYYELISNDQKRMGYCELRFGHSLNLYYYGNIGYRIKEEYRGHGYAYQATSLLIDLAKELGIDYLIITVSPDNIPSKKTINKIEGIKYLETVEVPFWHGLHKNEPIKEIYRIDLKD